MTCEIKSWRKGVEHYESAVSQVLLNKLPAGEQTDSAGNFRTELVIRRETAACVIAQKTSDVVRQAFYQSMIWVASLGK